MKAIITDLDKTLLHTDKSVSAYTVQIFEKCHKAGFLIVAATARPERAITDYDRILKFDALITLNGARIVMADTVIEHGIAEHSAKTILKQIYNLPELVLSMETADGIFSNVPILEWNPTVYPNFPELPSKGTIHKILLSSTRTDLKEKAEAALTDDTYLTVANGDLLQIMSKKATKWKGIQTVLNAVGLNPVDALYFGDDNDDLEAIKKCGKGVAVANALESIKEAADTQTLSNDEDGVALFLEKYYL